MLPITPSNFHFFYKKWMNKFSKLNDKNENNIYAKKVSDQLFDFVNNDPNNALLPYIKAWCDQVSNKTMNSDLLTKGLKQLMKQDEKLMPK